MVSISMIFPLIAIGAVLHPARGGRNVIADLMLTAVGLAGVSMAQMGLIRYRSCAAPKFAHGLTCWFTLGGRAGPSRLLVHGPGVRLAGAAGEQRRRQGRGDLGPPS